jgi:ubiquinone/menaquinone biosynthesis C-methylase UbiE
MHSTTGSDAAFTGSVPQIYSMYLVPLLTREYASDLATRLAERPVTRVLEVAAGTGVVTRAMDTALPAGVEIVATDLQQPMLDQASAIGTTRQVTWRQADAQALPFDDQTFDAAVCQFGVMFFPDKVRAHAEVRRVLCPGGTYFFNVWDRIELNELAHVVQVTLDGLFPASPPRFLARTPYGYFDVETVREDLSNAGFTATARVITKSVPSHASSARDVAVAYCHGTPVRAEIDALGPSALNDATEAATKAIEALYGTGAVVARIQAHVVIVSS